MARPSKPPARKTSPKGKPSAAKLGATSKDAQAARRTAKAKPAQDDKARIPRVAAGKRTVPVHALGDERMHLALPHLGKLKQGTLRTLCGLIAVTALSPFALAEKASVRCPACFRLVDGDLKTKG